MDIGNAVILFVAISSIMIVAVFGVMHLRGAHIQNTRLQNKIIFLVAGPCLVVLVSVMDVSIKVKIFIFGVSALAGVAYLEVFDKLRAAIYGRKGDQDPGKLNNK